MSSKPNFHWILSCSLMFVLVIPGMLLFLPWLYPYGAEGSLFPVTFMLLCAMALSLILFGVIYALQMTMYRAGERSALRERQEREVIEELERIEADKEAKRKQEEGRRRSELRSLDAACDEAETECATIAKTLVESEGWFNIAKNHFGAGAYPPFWNGIENCYRWLADYQTCVGRLVDLQNAYIASYLECAQFQEEATLRRFIMPKEVKDAPMIALRTAKNVDQLSYEGLSNHNAAIIWEQRRTTNAVIAGFGRLEDIVSNFSFKIDRASTEVTEAITGNSEILALGLSRLQKQGDVTLEQRAGLQRDRQRMMEDLRKIAKSSD